jgi:hypothetical protein
MFGVAIPPLPLNSTQKFAYAPFIVTYNCQKGWLLPFVFPLDNNTFVPDRAQFNRST